MAKDYYKLLGVSRDASNEEIKKAYRKLAHQHHPDKAGGNEAKFKEINEAYQILSNSEKKAQYDQFGTTFDGQGGPGFSGSYGGGAGFGGFGFNPNDFSGFAGGDFGDIFETIFEQFGGKKQKRARRGADMEAEEILSLKEAFSGVDRVLKFRTHIVCTKCNGAGFDESKGFSTCKKCAGKGEIREERRTVLGNFAQVVVCADCSGNGKIPNSICVLCSGKGRVESAKEVKFSIAAGIEDGQVIKIRSGGEAGEKGAESGDLYVRIRVKSDAKFIRKNDDIFTKHEIKISDALLQRKIKIEDVSGESFEFSVPEDFDLSEPLKIKGRGMPKFGSSVRGDFYIRLSVKTPKKLSKQAKEALEGL